ncbi:immunoglobulin-like domain-containing protein [Sphaerochaeta globosa]|uniref:Cell wall/surface repeat protein n=1 Tax=Sphaerochaeta globosa (strain ATCC BAA-1886 / DSM 22777 / Buddy) TaxID=158189 RepID=F0RRG1_SPHGB|nr:immunoglobulin-like domain-containing protein [Sphaerochaeta globosa]ADY14213.1 cell wall/surface repeat protein [Sphaerochaeta globosa str. Buddy]
MVKATEEVASDIAVLAIGFTEGDSTDSVMNDVVLPTSGTQGTRITWESSNSARIDTMGTVVRPAYSTGDAEVQLIATVERGTVSETRTFTLTVNKLPQTDIEAVEADKAALAIGFSGLDSASTVTQDVTLASSGTNGTTISWQSSVPQTISTTGVVTRPDYTGESDVEVTLTATISKGAISETKTFNLIVRIVLQEQTVTYESNGGSALPSQTVYWGRLIEEPEAPTRVGYSFEGWFTDSELTEQWDFSQDYVNGDVTLYAKWGAGYLISFNTTGAPLTPSSIIVGYGVQYGTFPLTLKLGHALEGWYTEPDGTGERVTEESLVVINANHTLHAYWIPSTYTITFDAKGGDIPNPSTKTVTYGQPYDELATVTKNGYTFAGWWIGENGTGNQITSDSIVMGTADRTLYAKWVFTVFTGQAGGLVFYENPNYEADGWRYLEAAPADWYDWETNPINSEYGWGDAYCQWGSFGYYVDNGFNGYGEIGQGEISTQKIVDFHDTLWLQYPVKGDYYANPTEYHERNNGQVAAKICSEYSVEYQGTLYDDWFLPSLHELNQIYLNLELQNLGGFYDRVYWCTGNDEVYGYVIRFEDGLFAYANKYYQASVRPIRAY